MPASGSDLPSDGDPAGTLPLVITPDAARYWRAGGSKQLGMYVLLLAVAIALFVTRDDFEGTCSVGALLLTLLLADSGTTWLRFLVGRIEVTDTELVVRRVIGRPAVTQRSALGYALYAPNYQPSKRHSIRSPRAYVMDGADQRVLQLVGLFYPRSRTEAILTALSPLPIDVINEPVNSDVIDSSHPTMRSVVDRHSTLAAVLFVYVPAVAVFFAVRLLVR